MRRLSGGWAKGGFTGRKGDLDFRERFETGALG